MARYCETADVKPEIVRFYSKAQNYQILVRPYIVEVNNGIPVHRRGEKIEFVNGEFVTDSKKIVEFLRNHCAYGIDFQEDKTPHGADEKIYARAKGVS